METYRFSCSPPPSTFSFPSKREEEEKGQTGKFDKSRKSLPFLLRVFLFPQGHIHSSRMSEKKRRGGGEGDPLSAKNLPPLLTCPQLYLSNGIRQFFLAWSQSSIINPFPTLISNTMGYLYCLLLVNFLPSKPSKRSLLELFLFPLFPSL